MKHVVLADDHPLFLVAVRAAIEGAGMGVAGVASRGEELLELVPRVNADAVLLDLDMPGVDGYDCLRHLTANHPGLPLFVLSAAKEGGAIRRALDAGALAFLAKSLDPNELAVTVRGFLNGAVVVRPPAAAEPRPAFDLDLNLTDREIDILRLVARGLPNSEIARALWITDPTVKFHLSKIYRKLGVANRTGATLWAQRSGLLDEGGPA